MFTKKLAASFIVTVALLPACSGGHTHTNPPAPDGPHTNPPGPTPDTPETPTTATPETPPPDNTGTPEATFPPPSPGEKVTTKKDGSCWVYPEVDCPPSPATCNPPPPKRVQCPTE